MLGHELARVLPELRRQAESRMTSRVTIHRKNGRAKDADGLDVTAWLTVATSVPFRLSAGRNVTSSRTVRVGESEVEVATREGHMPTWQTDLRDGDLLQVTAGEHAGAVVQVIEASFGDQQTARRVPVFEVDRPEEW